MLRKLVIQGASIAGIRIAGTGLSVGVSIAIARAFGSETLGVYAYCIALLGLAAVPISNGWSSMLLRLVSRENKVGGSARAMAYYGARGAVLVTLIATLLGYAAIHLASSDIATLLSPVSVVCIILLSVALFSDQLSAMRMASIRGVDRPALAQLPEMIIRPLILLSALALGWNVLGSRSPQDDLPLVFLALAVAAVISAIVGQAILIGVTQQHPRTETTALQRKTWLVSAAALAGSAGLVQLNGYVDMLILGGFAPAADIGLYRASLQIAMLASLGYIALNMLAGQRFSRLLADKDREGLARTATILARLALLSAIPFPVLIWLFGPQLLAGLFGSGFSGAAAPALIVAIGFCFSASIGMAHSLLIMNHQEILALRLTFIALALNVGLCLALIPHYGLIGAAMANMTASIGWNILLWAFARQKTGIDTSILGLAPRP